MCALGIFEDHHHARVLHDRLIEANARLDVHWLHRLGTLTEGTTTEVALRRPLYGKPIKEEDPVSLNVELASFSVLSSI